MDGQDLGNTKDACKLIRNLESNMAVYISQKKYTNIQVSSNGRNIIHIYKRHLTLVEMWS